MEPYRVSATKLRQFRERGYLPSEDWEYETPELREVAMRILEAAEACAKADQELYLMAKNESLRVV